MTMNQKPGGYLDLLELCSIGDRFSYDKYFTIVYNVATGFGRAEDDHELPFVCEEDTVASPTLAVVLGGKQQTMFMSGLDLSQLFHMQHRIQIHRPMPAAADYIVDDRIVDVIDKGPGRGALIYLEKKVRLAEDDTPLCTSLYIMLARGDGGIGGTDTPVAPAHPIPDREPDHVVEAQVRPEQAYLYALTGDSNPLHRVPSVARKAGFPGPILHGLCTYGMACHAIMKSVCAFDPDAIKEIDARFKSPVFLGSHLRFELWRDGDIVSFRALNEDRVVLDNGRCELRG